MKKGTIIYIGIAIILIGMLASYHTLQSKKEKDKPTDPTFVEKNSFNLNLLKEVNKDKKENYLISPYSIEIALKMLESGANGNTYDEIHKVIGDRKINFLDNEDIKVANALFIKNKAKDYVIKEFSDNLVKNYSSEILYDDFGTPKVINDWVNEKTNEMIPTLVDELDPDFLLGIVNAIAIDVKWQDEFETTDTYKEDFRNNKKTTEVDMMHNTYKTEDFKYFKTDNAQGIILPYEEKDGIQLEFVGILPNHDLYDYINNFDETELKSIDKNITTASNDLWIRLSLPKFEYDYTLENFKDVLTNMGIKDAFDKDDADFTKIITKEDIHKLNYDNLYVYEAIHKTKIELSEEGTKAAAVTGVLFAGATSIPEEPEIIKIKFDKPFMYMIREKNTNEVLFIGTVYEP